jgi:hypothetical protein
VSCRFERLANLSIYHLIFETEQPALSEGMKVLNGRYAQLFNRRLEASCLYVLENPVRAGLCETASEWPWSGCPALAA